jgi:hypothetical protein
MASVVQMAHTSVRPEWFASLGAHSTRWQAYIAAHPVVEIVQFMAQA